VMLGYPRGWVDLHVYAIYCVPEFHDCDCKKRDQFVKLQAPGPDGEAYAQKSSAT